jgi:hypothetical protein
MKHKNRLIKDLVQIQNPKSKKWCLIDTSRGKIIKYKSIPFSDMIDIRSIKKFVNTINK